MKSSANFLFTTAFFKPLADQFAYPTDPIIEDAATTLDAALTAAPDDETATAILEDWLASHPNLLRNIVPVPEADVEAACTSLTRRGELVKRYGLTSVEAALGARGVSLGEVRPARDADAGSKKAKAANTDAPAASSNPWADQWRAPRPVKTDAERQALRLEAQTAVIKNFGSAGAARYAKSAGKQLGGAPLLRK